MYPNRKPDHILLILILLIRQQREEHHVQQIRVDDTSNSNPRNVKKDGYKFDPNGDEVWNIKFPRRKSLFVEYATCDQKPSVEFDAHTNSHEESEDRNVIREGEVDKYGHVMLNDGAWTFDTFGNDTDPYKVDHEVGDGRPKE